VALISHCNRPPIVALFCSPSQKIHQIDLFVSSLGNSCPVMICPKYQPPGEKFIDRELKWNKIIRMDGLSFVAASEACLCTVCKKMKEMVD
jgi:hypothetical protein